MRNAATSATPTRDLAIRRATPLDAARVAEFAHRTFVEQFAIDNTPDNMKAHLAASFSPRLQEAELRDRSMVTLLGEIEDTLVAFAQIRRAQAPACVTGPDPIELFRFYVDRPWHGKGLAVRMMQAVDHTARTMEARTLWLGVWEHNPRAIAFYMKCGFTDVGSQPFLLGADRQTDRVMARRL
jgi:diamine N-acetyltransferase